MNRKNGRPGTAFPGPTNARNSEASVTRAEDVPALLALSDERDLWAARLLAEWQRGYQAGYADAVRDAERRANAEWQPHVLPVAEGLSHAQMDARRYPPDGRASWIAADDTFTAHPLSGVA